MRILCSMGSSGIGVMLYRSGMELDGALEHTWNWMEHTADGLSLHL